MPDSLWLFIINNAKALSVYAAIFVLLESRWPAKQRQPRWRKDSHLDLLYSFLMPMLVIPLIAVPLGWMSAHFLGPDLFAVAEKQPGSVTVQVDKAPQHGKLRVDANGRFSYAPEAGFAGIDGFALAAGDGKNGLTRFFLARVGQANPSGIEGSASTPPPIAFALTGETWSGEIAQGVSGGFLAAREWIKGLPLWMQIILAVFVVDFVGYWRHRFQHLPGFWSFHSIHHGSEQVDWLSTERFHYVDQVITLFAEQAVCILLFNDLYVLSASHLLRRGYGLFIHANLRWSYGPLNYVLVSPLMHRWHHAADPLAMDKNYATFFSFLDVVFGTLYLPQVKEDPQTFGVYQRTLPKSFFGQLIYPFRDFATARVR
jgi:sterol desaturase/sphingolipid hydroxylase (fatty acid hydroxylase superfamily)